MQSIDGRHGARLRRILGIATIFVLQHVHINQIAETTENVEQHFGGQRLWHAHHKAALYTSCGRIGHWRRRRQWHAAKELLVGLALEGEQRRFGGWFHVDDGLDDDAFAGRILERVEFFPVNMRWIRVIGLFVQLKHI